MSFPIATVQSPGFRDAVFDFAERTRYEINSAGRELFQKGALSASRTFVAAVRVPNEQAFVIGGFTPRTGAEPPPGVDRGFRRGRPFGCADAVRSVSLGRVQAALLVELPPSASAAVHGVSEPRGFRRGRAPVADRLWLRLDTPHSRRHPSRAMDGALGARAGARRRTRESARASAVARSSGSTGVERIERGEARELGWLVWRSRLAS